MTKILARRESRVGQTSTRLLIILWHACLCAIRFFAIFAWSSICRTKPPKERIAARTVAELFETLGPAYIKIGQILSTRRDILSEGITDELSCLRDRVSPLPFATVRRVFYDEFHQEIESVFSEFDTQPVASASIASVYRARLLDGRLVAVKILRPEAETLINIDLRLISSFANLASRFSFCSDLPLKSSVQSFGHSLKRQLDFRFEAIATKRMAALVATDSNIIIPYVVEEFCGSNVLTMQYIEGLGSVNEPSCRLREALLAALRFLYRMIFQEGLIHCDLHQGNLFLLPSGRAVLIDFGFMAELNAAERRRFARFFYAMSIGDGGQCTRIITEMATSLPPCFSYEEFRTDVTTLVKNVSGAKARDFQVAKFALGLFDIQRRFRVVGSSTFLMAIVALLVFEGIAKDVYPELDFQHEARSFIAAALT